jgi:hypothetical protein
MKRRSAALVLLAAAAFAGGLRAGADSFTDELQWLAKYTACLGMYNMA